MKKGQQTNQTELIRDGWQQVDMFGSCEIWTKGNDRLLWNPTTKIIAVYYQE